MSRIMKRRTLSKMKPKGYLILAILALLFFHLSCGSSKETHAATAADPERLAEALASRHQENPSPLSMIEAYQIAQNRATEWNNDSYIVWMAATLTEKEAYSYIFKAPYKGLTGCFKGSNAEIRIDVDPISGELVSFDVTD